jgi:hypothetical protein
MARRPLHPAPSHRQTLDASSREASRGSASIISSSRVRRPQAKTLLSYLQRPAARRKGLLHDLLGARPSRDGIVPTKGTAVRQAVTVFPSFTIHRDLHGFGSTYQGAWHHRQHLFIGSGRLRRAIRNSALRRPPHRSTNTLSPIALIPASRPVIVPSINGGVFGFISSPGTNGLSTGPADESVAQHGIARKVPINRANAVRTERKQNTITPYLLQIFQATVTMEE